VGQSSTEPVTERTSATIRLISYWTRLGLVCTATSGIQWSALVSIFRIYEPMVARESGVKSCCSDRCEVLMERGFFWAEILLGRTALKYQKSS